MFGYHESLYKVEKREAVAVTGGSRQVELRRASYRGLSAEMPYIAILDTNGEGEVTRDTLLLYEDEAAIETDWARLVSAEQVNVNDLGYVERIEDHHIGYRKDGGIAMY